MPGRAGPATMLPRRVMLAVAGGSLLSFGARAQTPEARAEMDKVLAGRTPVPGGIALDVPSIAENGLVVPVTIDVASPMSEADHITTVYLFADGNPNPLVAKFGFTAASGRAAASTRIRLAQTQNVVVLAESSTGALRAVSAEVKVTIGGCGG